MSLLQKIHTGKKQQPPRLLIYGTALQTLLPSHKNRLLPSIPAHERVPIDLEQDRTTPAVLKCPVCGHEYNSLDAIEVRGSLVGVGTRIDAAGTRVFHSPFKHGFAVDLEFSGKCGHDFIYTLEFSQGQIFVSQRAYNTTAQ